MNIDWSDKWIYSSKKEKDSWEENNQKGKKILNEDDLKNKYNSRNAYNHNRRKHIVTLAILVLFSLRLHCQDQTVN